MAQCEYKKTNGLQCEANATSDSLLCFSHNPTLQQAKQAAVRKGGLNRKLYQSYGESRSLQSPADIKKLLADTINGIWTGVIPANQPANTIGFLARCWMDIHQITDFEERMNQLEEKLNKIKA